MNKLRPYKNIYKIKIHKHTPVRRKRSVWVIDGLYNFGGYSCNGQNTPLVTDLQRVPKCSIKDEYKAAIDKVFTGDGLYETTDGKYWVQPKNPYKSDLFITKKLGIFKNIWQNKIRKR